jgi:hypothetical protein
VSEEIPMPEHIRKLSLFQAVAMAIGKHMERYPEATEEDAVEVVRLALGTIED